jgi:ABC-2 type transport system ATP-binding protein/ribosome-dependent ATPase
MTGIEATGLTKRFGNVLAVDGLSFRVDPGEVVGLLGANGAGKTTTMKMLLGLLTPTGGHVRIGGRPVREVDRRVLGYVPQGLGLYGDLTVAENLEFAAQAFGVATPSLDDAGMGAIADRRVSRISLGLRRRVAFVVARCHDPSVLILDEPTSGVGPLGRARLWETIHEMADHGAAVLVSTHYMDEAEECDRVVLMAEGEGVMSGTVSEVVERFTTVSVTSEVTDDEVLRLREAGATVLVAHPGWRIVGLGVGEVGRILGVSSAISETPSSFEEAFVALST